MNSYKKWQNKKLYQELKEDVQNPSVPIYPQNIGNGVEDLHSCAPSSQCSGIARKDAVSIPPQEFWPYTPVRKPDGGLGEKGDKEISLSTFNNTNPVPAGETPTISQGLPVRRESFGNYSDRRQKIQEFDIGNDAQTEPIVSSPKTSINNPLLGDPQINNSLQIIVDRLNQKLGAVSPKTKFDLLQSLLQKIIPQLSGGNLSKGRKMMMNVSKQMTPSNMQSVQGPLS